MHNFSDQCLDLARALLGNNLQYINEDGTITPAAGESSRIDEPGHAALAIGEFFERQVKSNWLDSTYSICLPVA